MNKKILTLLMLLSLFFVAPKAIEANDYDTDEDGRQIVVDKEVKAPSQDNWHENLSSEVITFAGENYVEFKIKVKNTGDEELKNIKVIDALPSQIKPIEYPGEYNEGNHDVTWHIDRLGEGEEKEFYIKAQIKNNDSLEQGRLFCVNNKAEGRSETDEYDSDTAQFCIDTRILGQETLPESGGNTLIATLLATSIIGAGILIRKIGRGELLSR